MRRFASAVLMAVGGLLLAVAVGLPLFVAPAVGKLPYNMQQCPEPPKAAPAGCLHPSVAEATNAQVLRINSSGVNVIESDLRTTIEVIPDIPLTAKQQEAHKLDSNGVIWSVYQTVAVKSSGEPISNSSTQLALDRTTAEADKWDGQWIESPDSKIEYTGLTYKFPFGTKKHDYQIYDTDIRAATPAKFESVEDIDGLQTYHFVQQIPDTKVTVDGDSMAALLARFAPAASSGSVSYRTTREVWVDPVTGVFIKVRERPHQELTAVDGTKQVLLDADFVYTPETIANSVKSAKDNGALLSLVRLYIPIGAGVLGLILGIAGFLLMRTRRPGAETGAWADDLPQPRHQLRQDGQFGEEAAATS